MSLQGKKILLGVCGSIAAYKAAYLTRLLVKDGASIRVVMTPDATAFVGPLTFSTLSKHPVAVDFYNQHDGSWNNHVEMGLWPDLMLIAPATANTMAMMASGAANNLLLAVYLSARCPVMISPAMDLDMWHHPSTRANCEKLISYHNILLQPASGELASGLSGEGRMPEPEELLKQIQLHFSNDPKLLAGKKILITAGPTHEQIDAVRFIGNHSSGKMGFTIADACKNAGADVTVIHGPVSVSYENAGVKMVSVKNAAEMYDACSREFPACDIFIASAAVADFTPERPVEGKIKKSKENETGLSIRLTRTKDILAEMGRMKKQGQLVVGFALETENELENARKKLNDKNADIIVLNSLNETGAGFQHNTNKISILDTNNNLVTFELKSKQEVAADIVHYITRKFNA